MDFDSGICQSVDTHEGVTQITTAGAVDLPIEAPEEEVVSVPFDNAILEDSLDTTGTGSDISQLIQLDHSYDSPATPSCPAKSGKRRRTCKFIISSAEEDDSEDIQRDNGESGFALPASKAKKRLLSQFGGPDSMAAQQARDVIFRQTERDRMKRLEVTRQLANLIDMEKGIVFFFFVSLFDGVGSNNSCNSHDSPSDFKVVSNSQVIPRNKLDIYKSIATEISEFFSLAGKEMFNAKMLKFFTLAQCLNEIPDLTPHHFKGITMSVKVESTGLSLNQYLLKLNTPTADSTITQYFSRIRVASPLYMSDSFLSSESQAVYDSYLDSMPPNVASFVNRFRVSINNNGAQISFEEALNLCSIYGPVTGPAVAKFISELRPFVPHLTSTPSNRERPLAASPFRPVSLTSTPVQPVGNVRKESDLISNFGDCRRQILPVDVSYTIVERPGLYTKYKYFFLSIFDPFQTSKIAPNAGDLFTEHNNNTRKYKSGYFAFESCDPPYHVDGLKIHHSLHFVFEVNKCEGLYSNVAMECEMFCSAVNTNPKRALLVPIETDIKRFEAAYVFLHALSTKSGIGKTFGPNPHTAIMKKLQTECGDDATWITLCKMVEKLKTEEDIAQYFNRVYTGGITVTPKQFAAVKALFRRQDGIIKSIQSIKTWNFWSHKPHNEFLKDNFGRCTTKCALHLFNKLIKKSLFDFKPKEDEQGNVIPEIQYDFTIYNADILDTLLRSFSNDNPLKKILINSHVSPTEFYNIFCTIFVRGGPMMRANNRHLIISGPHNTGKSILMNGICSLLDGIRIINENTTNATKSFIIPSASETLHGLVLMEDTSSKSIMNHCDSALRPYLDGQPTIARAFQKAPREIRWPVACTTTNCPPEDDDPSLIEPKWLEELHSEIKKKDPSFSLSYNHVSKGAPNEPQSLKSMRAFVDRGVILKLNTRMSHCKERINDTTESDAIDFLLSFQIPACPGMYGVKSCKYSPCGNTSSLGQHHVSCKLLLRLWTECECEKKYDITSYRFHQVFREFCGMFFQLKHSADLVGAMATELRIPYDPTCRTPDEVLLYSRIRQFVYYIWAPLSALVMKLCNQSVDYTCLLGDEYPVNVMEFVSQWAESTDLLRPSYTSLNEESVEGYNSLQSYLECGQRGVTNKCVSLCLEDLNKSKQNSLIPLDESSENILDIYFPYKAALKQIAANKFIFHGRLFSYIAKGCVKAIVNDRRLWNMSSSKCRTVSLAIDASHHNYALGFNQILIETLLQYDIPLNSRSYMLPVPSLVDNSSIEQIDSEVNFFSFASVV